MSKWEFTIKELKALQQDNPDTEVICQKYVEWVLLSGYNISTKSTKVIGGKVTN